MEPKDHKSGEDAYSLDQPEFMTCLSVLVEWIVLSLCILNLFNNLLNSIQFWVSVEPTVHYSRFHLQQILTVHKQNLKL